MKRKDKIIGSIGILALFILFLGIGYYLSKPRSVDDGEIFTNSSKKSSFQGKDGSNENNTNDVQGKAKGEVTAEIRGEVAKPGIYTLKNGSRVKDLVQMAGGLTENADTDSLIQVTPVKDNMYIRIYKKGQRNAAVQTQQNVGGAGTDSKVNINMATKEQLMTVSGIGSTTAQKIIDYREKNGAFSSIDDLKKVGRIGDKTLNKIKDKIDVN